MTGDWFVRPGVILFTGRHEACVRFYRDAIGLAVLYEKPGLVAFAFGSGYLMVETGGAAVDGAKPRSANPTVLRFDVTDIDAAAARLVDRGVPVDRQTWDWGTIGVFHDPDGNRCELRAVDTA